MKQAPFKIFSITQPNPLPHFTGTKEEVYAWLDNNAFGPDGFEVYCTATETAQDARKFLEENNPFASKFYRMNPETDDVLLNGRGLKNGMMVLLENAGARVDMDEILTEVQAERALERNRWCTVGALEIDATHVYFIGVYEDGSKRARKFPISYPWLVKKNSVREVEDKKNELRKLVAGAMTEVIMADGLDASPREKAEHVMQKAEKYVDEILKLL